MAISATLAWAIWNIDRALHGKGPITYGEFIEILGNDIKFYSNQVLEAIGLTADLGESFAEGSDIASKAAIEYKAAMDVMSAASIDMANNTVQAVGIAKGSLIGLVEATRNIKNMLLNNLRAVVGVGSGRAEELLKFQRFSYGSDREFREALAESGLVWTGTGWLSPEQAERQGVQPQPIITDPGELKADASSYVMEMDGEKVGEIVMRHAGESYSQRQHMGGIA